MTRIGWKLTLALSMLGAFAIASSAVAEVDVHASLSRETVEVDQTVQLTVVVTGVTHGVEEPQLPRIDYLRVVSRSSRRNVQLINGDLQSTIAWEYRLHPSREGTYTVPGISVNIQDQVYTTDPMTLTVVAPKSPLPSSPSNQVRPPDAAPGRPGPPDSQMPTEQPGDARMGPVAIRTQVDTRTPWVGEQVTLTLRFMQAHSVHLLGNAEYDPADTEGLVAEPLPEEAQHTETIDGVPYEIITRRTALIAPAPGEYTIGPATVTFRRGFMHDEETLSTDPITLNVRPLPKEGRPEGFTGVVGRLQLGMSLPNTEVKVGEATSLKLTVRGTGDLRRLSPPEVPVEGDARVYQSGQQQRIGPQDTPRGPKIGGSVEFEYLIMPRSEGPLTVEPIVLDYFDPEVDRYQFARTSSATITVLPGEGGQAPAQPSGEQLRYIKDTGLALTSSEPITSRLWFWAIQLVPLLALGWALRVRAERLRREADPRYRRHMEAARNARAALGRIQATDDPAEVYRRVDEVMAQYIAAKTDASASEISPEAARARLIEAGADEPPADQAARLLERLRAGAYAPGSSQALDPGEALRDARSLVDDLEEALR